MRKEAHTAAAAARRAAAQADIPPLVRVLGCNPVTAAVMWGLLNTRDAAALARLHPVIAVAVARVPWCDMVTRVSDVVAWRRALPAATGVHPRRLPHTGFRAVTAALEGLATVDLEDCAGTSHATTDCLPSSLVTLTLTGCTNETFSSNLKFARFAALAVLECNRTHLADADVASLPPSLQVLRARHTLLSGGANFRHLVALRLLDCGDTEVTSAVVATLPPCLTHLYLNGCTYVFGTRGAGTSCRHLPVLTVLDACGSSLGAANLALLPPSLAQLDMSQYINLTSVADFSFSHLRGLTRLVADGARLSAASIGTLPPTLQELHLELCFHVKTATFAHLPALRELNARAVGMTDAGVASLPPSLVGLCLCNTRGLSATALFPSLPALLRLDVSNTNLSDAGLASLPPSLLMLRVDNCEALTPAGRLNHLPALRQLQAFNTRLASGALAACRARGCFVPALGNLPSDAPFYSQVAMPDGALAMGDVNGRIQLWEVDGDAGWRVRSETPPEADTAVVAMVPLDGGSRLAAVMSKNQRHSRIVVWDVASTPPTRLLTIAVPTGASKALVALPGGQLAVGGWDPQIRVFDVATGGAVAKLAGHSKPVRALVALPGGRLASCAGNDPVRVWDVHARRTVASLATGFGDRVQALAVLSDGRLASGLRNGTVQVWDVGSRTCTVTWRLDTISDMVALPADRLAVGLAEGSIHVWDGYLQAPVAALHGAGGEAAGLQPLPGGRLASMSEDGVHLWLLPPSPLPAAAGGPAASATSTAGKHRDNGSMGFQYGDEEDSD